MVQGPSHLAALAVLGLLLLTLSESAPADVPAPTIPSGQGKACVADTDFMRRNHMRVLDHQRDGTVRQGIRSGKFSLRKCVACHAVPGPDRKPVSYADPKHFCRACHDFAAVRIDCFECHASRPEGNVSASQGRCVNGGDLLRTSLP